MTVIKNGTRIGPYTIIEELPGARGGMATLYRASDSYINLEVALKVSRTDYRDPRFANALKKEVDIMHRLHHPGVVRLLTLPLRGVKAETYLARAIELPDNPWFYAMEYLPGGMLKDLVDKVGILPFNAACSIITRLTDTLTYLHSQGVTHMDIKPENILFRYTCRQDMPIEPVMIDFGIAAQTKYPRAVGGSLLTMAPEQLRHVRGELPPEAPLDTEKMDIYSLGVVTYRLWTGDYPFGGKMPKRITSAVLNSAVIPPSELNPDLPPEADRLMLHWLAKEPGNRPSLDEIKRYMFYWSEGVVNFPELPKKKRKRRKLFGK